MNIRDETEESIVSKMIGRKLEKVQHQSFMTDKQILKVEDLGRGRAVYPPALASRRVKSWALLAW